MNYNTLDSCVLLKTPQYLQLEDIYDMFTVKDSQNRLEPR